MPAKSKKRRGTAKQERQAYLEDIYQKLRRFLNDAESKRQTNHQSYSKDIQTFIKDLEKDITELKRKGASDKKERQAYLENTRKELSRFLNDAESKRQKDSQTIQSEYSVFIKGIKKEVASIKEDTKRILERI